MEIEAEHEASQIHQSEFNMSKIVFFDLEIDSKERISDMGAVDEENRSFHLNSMAEFKKFIQETEFIAGHNIFDHDLKYLQTTDLDEMLSQKRIIDTLYLSPLLFPKRPYHKLLKDDKLQSDEANNPLNDSKKAKELFFDECNAFHRLDEEFKEILYHLLKDQKEFKDFFLFLNFQKENKDAASIIAGYFQNKICENATLQKIIYEHPIALAYALALIHCDDIDSVSPAWVTKNFPGIQKVFHLLKGKACLSNCSYCDEKLNVKNGLKQYFNFDSFKTYEGEGLQEQAAQAAIDGRSLLAIFPTGGGKSVTFQVPALMEGETLKGLTVVISPLQSLMKDQVDNLEKKQITNAVTINGLLDPIERQKSCERVQDGSASLLYIAPESLRSKTIESLLLGRNIVRFVIDEAHCFSTWGQDFRVDYLYIADFIRSLQEKKNLEDGIPVSCFTATAKQKVIQDIQKYFKERLNLELRLYHSKASRTNLKYKVFSMEDDNKKYHFIRDLIQEKENCPTIIYVSRTRRATELAQKLTSDGFHAEAFHGRMKAEDKIKNQNAFIQGDINIIVATSAFGMGVDKKDVILVIHYEISDSLENYVQEAGRGGRDESITADCFVLFNEDDLDKHFILLNQTKLYAKEINQIWRTIKQLTKAPRFAVSQSALEIARETGWPENQSDIETRVKTAINALEEVGYLKRRQNIPKIYASSIQVKTQIEAANKIIRSHRFTEKEKDKARRIMSKLFSQKNIKKAQSEEAESRIDYIADLEGMTTEEVSRLVTLLREEKILADQKDLTASIRKEEKQNKASEILKKFLFLEEFLLGHFEEGEGFYSLKKLNEKAEEQGYENISLPGIKTVLNFWAIKNWIKSNQEDNDKIRVYFVEDKKTLKKRLEKRRELSEFIIEYLFGKTDHEQEENCINFSILELKTAFQEWAHLFKENTETTVEDIEDSLFYLQRIKAIKIEGGFLVWYNKLTIERLEKNNQKQYTSVDYEKLADFYANKVAQIHIVGEYARKMLESIGEAQKFLEDYFHLNNKAFLNKYFPNHEARELLKKNITRKKYKQLFGDLSERQREIIDDKENKYIVVAAGPGSGKTKILVHKLAALYLMEDVKHEQFLTLTFSRAAATEFKKRLVELIGNAAHYIEIRTFHSYCFDLLGQIGDLKKTKNERGQDILLQKTIKKIQNNEVERSKITRMVLVIDEAQDMSKEEFRLIQLLMEKNEELRVIAVGDDDQNIYEFRGSHSKYFQSLIIEKQAKKYELSENYRSKKNIVEFSDHFVQKIKNRLKKEPIQAKASDHGKIKTIEYTRSENLIFPLSRDVLNTELSGKTCILTKSNDEAIEITGLLLKNGHPAKLIESNDHFSLYDLVEIRFFLSQCKIDEQKTGTIDDETWQEAKASLKNEFEQSSQLGLCFNIIKDFEEAHNKSKYKSDLELFVRESKMEDFFNEDEETIFVSTMHKAKGREFDNVFIMLNKFFINREEDKRVLYVAMTRAKKNLVIHHSKENYFLNINVENHEKINDGNIYPQAEQFIEPFSHRDVHLSYFKYKQRIIARLRSGAEIDFAKEEGACKDSYGNIILKFSKKALDKIQKKELNGRRIKKVVINFMLYWQNKEEKSDEILIILPTVHWHSMEGVRESR